MRIGVDAREICGHATGVGRYLAGLLAEWSDGEAAERHQFVLYAHGEIAAGLDTRRFATRLVPGAGGTWWEQVQLPTVAKRDHLDVWFAPAYSTPLRLDVPTVVAIHDLSFVAHPEWFRLREGARRRLFAARAAQKASAIVTISEFSRGELIERLNVPAEKIRVIPPGIDHPFSPSEQLSAAAATRHDVGPRILFVGSVFNRRHVRDLIAAFTPIARRHPSASLDIVGDNRSFPHEDIGAAIAAAGLERAARWHRYVPDDQLRALYQQAGAFAFLSEYEGLGLTPLEALAAGIPPVLLDTPVARESCEDAALYVPLHDIPATTRALEEAIFSEPTRARILDAAPRVLAKYQLATRRGRHLVAPGAGVILSIIIVSFNARDDLGRCLQSLSEAPPSVPHEIIVVDNASTDGSADVARRAGARTIEAGSNGGFARANNIGIRASSGASVLLLNSDTIVPPGAIDRLQAELDADASVAVVGPRLVDAQGRVELSFGRMISPFNEWRQKRLAGGDVEALTRTRQFPDWVSGACLLVRRADAIGAGLLDERYFMYTEDVDFCAAIRARGRRVLFVPDVEIVHLRGRSRASAPGATALAYRRSQIAFYEKHHRMWAPLLRLYLRARGADR